MTMNRNALAVPALGLPLLVAALLAGAAPAQEETDDLPDPGMLPDHPLYFVTSASEAVGTFFTFGDADKAERALELSERRLAEVRALAEQGKPEAAERAAERYRDQLDRAVTRAEQARARAEDEEVEEPEGEEEAEEEETDEALTRVAEATSRHQEVLAEVYQKVPEQARPGIERAMEASERGGARAAKAREAARGGRPDSPGRGPPRGKGPPEDRGRPDSAGAARPDTAGGR